MSDSAETGTRRRAVEDTGRSSRGASGLDGGFEFVHSNTSVGFQDSSTRPRAEVMEGSDYSISGALCKSVIPILVSVFLGILLWVFEASMIDFSFVWALYDAHREREVANVGELYLLSIIMSGAFIAVGELFVLLRPTRQIGITLRGRSTNAGRNWKVYTTQSFAEAACAVAMMCYIYFTYEDALLAIQAGTATAVVVIVLAEYFWPREVFSWELCKQMDGISEARDRERSSSRRRRQSGGRGAAGNRREASIVSNVDESEQRNSEAQDACLMRNNAQQQGRGSMPAAGRRGSRLTRHMSEGAGEHVFKVLPLLCVVLYVANRTVSIVFTFIQDASLATVLTLVATLALLLLGKGLATFGPVRVALSVLQNRWTNMTLNWRKYPVRSFVECGCSLGVIYGTYALDDDIFSAVKTGMLSGVIVVLTGELLRKFIPQAYRRDVNSSKIVPVLLLLLAYVGASLFNTIYTTLTKKVEIAFFLATFCSVVLLGLSESVFVLWRPASRAAYILQDRVFNMRWNWRYFPHRSFVELGIWIGVAYGTYAIYYDPVVAIQLGTLSGMIVTLCGEYVKSNWMQFHLQSSVSHAKGEEALAGDNSDRIRKESENLISGEEGREGVATGSRVRGGGQEVRPDRQQRPSIDDFMFQPPLASFFGRLSEDIGDEGGRGQAGVGSIFSGEGSVSPVTPFSLVCLICYGICVALYLIYENIRNIEIAFVLATFAGVIFLTVSQMLIIWRPTRTAGNILQARILQARCNWRLYPMRSFIEMGCWLGSIYGSYAVYGDLVVALQLGTLSGIAVILGGEYFSNSLRQALPHPPPPPALPLPPRSTSVATITALSATGVGGKGQSSIQTERELLEPVPGSSAELIGEETDHLGEQQPAIIPLICLFAFFGAGAFNLIFEKIREIEIAIILATLAGVAFIVLGDIFVSWAPTRDAGNILQGRVLGIRDNWMRFPLRTFSEFGCLFGVTYGSYAIYNDLSVAVQLGTLSGLVVTLVGEKWGGELRQLFSHKLQLDDGDAEKVDLDAEKDTFTAGRNDSDAEKATFNAEKTDSDAEENTVNAGKSELDKKWRKAKVRSKVGETKRGPGSKRRIASAGGVLTSGERGFVEGQALGGVLGREKGEEIGKEEEYDEEQQKEEEEEEEKDRDQEQGQGKGEEEYKEADDDDNEEREADDQEEKKSSVRRGTASNRRRTWSSSLPPHARAAPRRRLRSGSTGDASRDIVSVSEQSRGMRTCWRGPLESPVLRKEPREACDKHTMARPISRRQLIANDSRRSEAPSVSYAHSLHSEATSHSLSMRRPLGASERCSVAPSMSDTHSTHGQAISRRIRVRRRLRVSEGRSVSPSLLGDSHRDHNSTTSVSSAPVPRSMATEEKEKKDAKILPLPLVAMFIFVGAIVFNTIYTHLRSVSMAFVLATLTGIGFVVVGDIFVFWKPTRTAGLVLQGRVVNSRENWERHTMRSLLELGSACSALWLTYGLSHDLVVATEVGTAVGISVVLIVEAATVKLHNMERQLFGELMDDARRSSPVVPLLALPYDALFHLGGFLTPEELLSARLCCRTTNQMLCAEASRWWTHISLRASSSSSLSFPFGGGGTAAAMMAVNRVADRHPAMRSMIYEAVQILKALLDKMLKDQRRSSIMQLRSPSRNSLKFVYLNARWIRAEAMRPKDAEMVEIKLGEPGYMVFMYMPDKDILGITEKNSDGQSSFIIPNTLYSRLQKDPLSFVAAETVRNPRAVTKWHLLVVLLIGMIELCLLEILF